MTAWNADTEADIGGADAVTLVEGSSFCISADSGDISPDGGTNGAFYQDTRIVSRWILRINGALREPLVAQRPDTFEATFVGRASWPDGRFDSPLMVGRNAISGQAFSDDITLENYSAEAVDCDIEILVDADQADLFEVKGGRPTQRRRHHPKRAGRKAADRSGPQRTAAWLRHPGGGAEITVGRPALPRDHSGEGQMVHQRYRGSADQRCGSQ